MTYPSWDASRAITARTASGIDARAAESAVLMLLHALGEDPSREGLKETPARVARAWAELTAGAREDPRKHLERCFDLPEATGIIVQRDIPFYSLCEHHLLPFHGRASIAYIPNVIQRRVVGLSKLVRLVRGYAARLQVQERLTAQIAEALVGQPLEASGVAVVVRAEHLCIGMRGIKAPGSVTVTSEVRGLFFDDARARAEVTELLR